MGAAGCHLKHRARHTDDERFCRADGEQIRLGEIDEDLAIIGKWNWRVA